MTPALFAASIYWHLPILVILISLVYAATRFDEWDRILHYAWRVAVFYILVFMGSVFVVLWFLSSVVPAVF
jgi:hypothetical protein